MPATMAFGTDAVMLGVSNHPDWHTDRKRRARETDTGNGACTGWMARKRVRRQRHDERIVDAPFAREFKAAQSGVKARPDPFAEMMATLAAAADAVEVAAATRRDRDRVRLSPYEDVLEQLGVDVVRYELGL